MDINCTDLKVSVLGSLSSETQEELDHAVVARGYSYDSIENAFEYLEKKELDEFSNAIARFRDAVTQDEKNEALMIIIKVIE